jgi:cephalosporin hydroxylase
MGKDGSPGASLRAFQDYFHDAPIIGADIDSRVLFNERRIRTFQVDQCRRDSLAALSEPAQGFRLLIDDGLHSPNANLAVLEFGLPLLQARSWIVIEDIVPEALPLWRLVAALLPADYATSVVRAKTTLVFCVTRRAETVAIT